MVTVAWCELCGRGGCGVLERRTWCSSLVSDYNCRLGPERKHTLGALGWALETEDPPLNHSYATCLPSSHLILCRPLLLLPPIPPSITVFSNESTLCMSWPKYWSFSFSIIPSKEIPGLISFRMDRSEERRVGKECRSRWSPYH